MKSFKTIKRFIDDCFSIYDIDPSLHFFDYDEDDFPFEVPIFENNRMDEDIIHKLSEILGLNEVDIINADKKAMKKIYNKYAYFKLNLNCNYKCNGLYNKFVLQFPLPLGVKGKIF